MLRNYVMVISLSVFIFFGYNNSEDTDLNDKYTDQLSVNMIEPLQNESEYPS
ncbi:hypothetical protein [Halolactibacillus halophilus]|jgi:hypothetical protein|nr:hypothetical protein [Halolactibacillus halophilus]